MPSGRSVSYRAAISRSSASSVAFAAFFVYGAIIMKLLRREVFDIRNALGLRVAPDVGVLSVLLYIFASVFLIVATGCAYLIWRA